MRILHTSDWHLGRTLYGKKRYEEFDRFLQWLLHTIQEQRIDILIIAGDIFDTTAPSNQAQEQYYSFLSKVHTSTCQHIIVIGGNHDSASFLNAPQALLKALNIHVVGAVDTQTEDELIVLKKDGDVQAIICAVPYLRDKDIRQSIPGESASDKDEKLIQGIQQHYAMISELAVEKRAQLGQQAHYIPIIGTGHLFAAGGAEGDGVRDLYVGSLAKVSSTAFPASLDYVALGHLHIPQTVNGEERIRYSGSPLAMGFGEATQQKMVLLVEIDTALQAQQRLQITELAVPCFQRLQQIKGDFQHIRQCLQQFSPEENVWLEIEYDGEEVIPNLREKLEVETQDKSIEILRIKNQRIRERVLEAHYQEESLQELDVYQVFDRCLEAHQVPQEQRPALKQSYKEVVLAIAHQEDGEVFNNKND